MDEEFAEIHSTLLLSYNFIISNFIISTAPARFWHMVVYLQGRKNTAYDVHCEPNIETLVL